MIRNSAPRIKHVALNSLEGFQTILRRKGAEEAPKTPGQSVADGIYNQKISPKNFIATKPKLVCDSEFLDVFGDWSSFIKCFIHACGLVSTRPMVANSRVGAV